MIFAMEKIVPVLIAIFAGVLYLTRDAGFDFASASPEKRANYVVRHAKAVVKNGGMLPAFRSKLVEAESTRSGKSVNVLIQLDANTAQAATIPTACTAYAKTPLPDHNVKVHVRFVNPKGRLMSRLDVNLSVCHRWIDPA